jgi:hypothetical protein
MSPRFLKKSSAATSKTGRTRHEKPRRSDAASSSAARLQDLADNHGVLSRSRVRVQRDLVVGGSNDQFEQEANRIADQVMRMPAVLQENPAAATFGASNHAIQRKCACGGTPGPTGEHCRKKRLSLQRRTASSHGSTDAPSLVHEVLRSPGQPLDTATRVFMEPRFGHDFSGVRVHTGTAAARSAQDLSAHAYTLGRDIVFGATQFAPATGPGQRLIAHELTHVLQQKEGRTSVIQRDCSDPNFCTPYATPAEAANAEWWIRNTYMRAEGLATYGSEVNDLYEQFLNRSPGDSLAPVRFSGDSSYLVSSFKESGDTTDDIDNVIDLVGNRLTQAPGWPLQDSVPTMMSLANFLSPSEMNNRPINYSNPFSVAGHIAGGIGSSDAGADYRRINYANVTLEKNTLFGSTGYVWVELTPQYEVFDAVDFCPGDCGSAAEQIVTIPMSRLEASGAAYDVPFQVNFTAEPRSKRFWF